MEDNVVFVSLKSIDEIVTFLEVLSQLIFKVRRNGQIGFQCKTGICLQIRESEITFPHVVTLPECRERSKDGFHSHFIFVIVEMVLCNRSIVRMLFSMTT
jgi:hypothetical protein